MLRFLAALALLGVTTQANNCTDTYCSLSCQNSTEYSDCQSGIWSCYTSDESYNASASNFDSDLYFDCIHQVYTNNYGNQTYDCSCFYDTLQCEATNCWDNDDNCTSPCLSDYYVDCLIVSDGCYDAFQALANHFWNNDSISVISPTIINNWVNNTYCENNPDNCDSYWWSFWGCYKDCIFDDCVFNNCGDEFDACANNDTCYSELSYVMSLEETYGMDTTDDMTERLISYYCLFETDSGECTSQLWSLFTCYYSNCGEASDDCLDNQCSDAIDACFADQDCGNTIEQVLYYDNVCEEYNDDGSENEYYSSSECESLVLNDDYEYIQQLCFFGGYNCDDTLKDAYSCYVHNCTNETESSCNIVSDCTNEFLNCYFDQECYKTFWLNFESWLIYMYQDSSNFIIGWPSEYNSSVNDWCKNEYNGTCDGYFWSLFECFFGACIFDDDSCAYVNCESEIEDCLQDNSCSKDLEWAIDTDDCDLEESKDDYCSSNSTHCNTIFEAAWTCAVDTYDCVECDRDCNCDCDSGNCYDNCTSTDAYTQCVSNIWNCIQSYNISDDSSDDNTDIYIGCYRQAFNNDSLDCDCVEDLFYCQATTCWFDSDGNDTDCFNGCVDGETVVDCYLSETCYTAWSDFVDSSWFSDDNSELFTPTDITEWVDDYCDGFTNCNDDFYDLYGCIESCFTDECVWEYCTSYIDICLDNSTCYSQISWMYEMEDNFGDISDYLGGLLGGYYCNYMVDGGCNSLLSDAISCYQDNCDSDKNCIGTYCSSYLEDCFNDEDCGEAAMAAMAYSNICENGDDDTFTSSWFNISACNDIFSNYDEYEWLQEVCFFGDYNCNDLFKDVVSCNLMNCNDDDDEHNDWENNDNDNCNIVTSCTNQVVDCWLTKDCYDTFWLNWDSLSLEIASNLFAFNTPLEYNETIKTWCDSSSDYTCGNEFWSLWGCFSNSCVFSGCVWDYCTSEVTLCAENTTCATDIAYISNVNAGSDAEFISEKEQYCSGTGTCNSLFNTAWDCYETNCLNSSQGTSDNETTACESDGDNACISYDGGVIILKPVNPNDNIVDFDFNLVIETTLKDKGTVCLIVEIEDDDTNGDYVKITAYIYIYSEADYNAVKSVISQFDVEIIENIYSTYGVNVTVTLNPDSFDVSNAANCGIVIDANAANNGSYEMYMIVLVSIIAVIQLTVAAF